MLDIHITGKVPICKSAGGLFLLAQPTICVLAYFDRKKYTLKENIHFYLN